MTRHCRVALFIDAQNLYERFREIFGVSFHFIDGQFDPMALGKLLVSRGPSNETWELAEVRAYVGRPNALKQPKGAAAQKRQTDAWTASGVVVKHRDLQYIDWPVRAPRQKGVDVELANDVYRRASKFYDVGIVISWDSDMIPAMEAVYEERGLEPTPRLCVVGLEGSPRRLRFGDTRAPSLYCFYLSRADYDAIHDSTDYTRPIPKDDTSSN